MKSFLKIDSVFIYSETSSKIFFTRFGEKLNVIYGPNTSGKSTLIQLLLFAFGINDNKIKLTDILSENIFVRVDIKLFKQGSENNFTLIRKDETLYVKDDNSRVLVFNGISANHSVEHVKLKSFFNDLFGFSLTLENKSGISQAPIETIFLPYYVSQDVGWVYLRKSFSNMDFYKNFKEDFLDYYLGVVNNNDKERRKELENRLFEKIQQYNFYSSFEKNNKNIENAIVLNKAFQGKGNEFIEEISKRKSELLILENEYVKQSNLLTYNSQRLSVISKVDRNHKNQVPGKDPCPTCNQILPSTINDIYGFYQEENDTVKVKSDLQKVNKDLQSKINSLSKKIAELRTQLKIDYNKYLAYSNDGVTLDEWISTKASIQLESSIVQIIGELALEISRLKEELKAFQTDEGMESERLIKNKVFKQYYNLNNITLDVPRLVENRFNYIYELSSFPFQGAQLHLAVLSYHFAFNRIIKETPGIHRLPFILDSVFKEDIDANNKEKILHFISANKPNDTQTIISIADSKAKDPKIEYYKQNVFSPGTNFICIGNGTDKKALLVDYDSQYDALLSNSFEIIETV